MKIKRIIAVLITAALVMIMPVGISFADSGIVLTKLATPTNFRLSKGVLTWDAVQNADEYEVSVDVWKGNDGVGHPDGTKDTSFDLGKCCLELMSGAGYTDTNGLKIEVTVCACSKNTDTFAASDKAQLEYSFSDLGISAQLTKLATPTNFRLSKGVLTWDAVQNADEYEVSVDVWKGDDGIGRPEGTKDTSFDLGKCCLELMSGAGYTDTNGLKIEVTVYARSKNTSKYAVSDKAKLNYNFSDLDISTQLTKLDTPSNLAVRCSILTWDAVQNADEYEIGVDIWKGNNGIGRSAGAKGRSFDLGKCCRELMSSAGHTDTSGLKIEVTICARSKNSSKYASSDKARLELTFADLQPHSFANWKISRSATELNAGERTRICPVCGTTERISIAQLSPSLPAVKISKPKAAKKAATVKWKKISKKNLKNVKRVQIQYSPDSSFRTSVKTAIVSAKKTSKKIKGLTKGKKYYIRIRAYTGGHVSRWSGVKSVKIK